MLLISEFTDMPTIVRWFVSRGFVRVSEFEHHHHHHQHRYVTAGMRLNLLKNDKKPSHIFSYCFTSYHRDVKYRWYLPVVVVVIVRRNEMFNSLFSPQIFCGQRKREREVKRGKKKQREREEGSNFASAFWNQKTTCRSFSKFSPRTNAHLSPYNQT